MKCVILGAGGHARSVAGVAIEELDLPIVAFVDIHSEQETIEQIYNLPIVPGKKDLEETLKKLRVQTVIIAVGNSLDRNEIYTRLKERFKFPNLISPSAIIKRSVVMGEGNIFLSLAYIGPYTQIGNNNIFNTGCIVEHECKIGSSNHIAPNSTLLGRVTIGNKNFIASGAILRPKLTLADQLVIGANSFVNQDLKTVGTYFGTPARLFKAGKQ